MNLIIKLKKEIYLFQKALILICYLPWILWLLIKEYKIHCIIISILGLSLVCILQSDKVELRIKDLQLAFNKNVHRTKTEYIVIHHSGGDTSATVNDIAKIHFGERGWTGIGYHYFITADGTIFNLRDDSEREVPHAIGFNNNCIAICLSGNFSKNKVPEIQWKIALELVRVMMSKYNVDVEHVIGHRELSGNDTECPGKLFDLEQFRKEL